MATKIPRIVVIGGVYADMTIKCSEMPQEGSSLAGSSISYLPSGPGVLESVQAALCGCEVYLIGKVGGDVFANFIRDALAENNVKTMYIFCSEPKNTGVIVTIVNSLGENSSIICPGANSALNPQEIQLAEQIISTADIVLIHCRLSQDSVTSAIRCAKLHGKKVILNPAKPLNESSSIATDVPVEYFNADIMIANLHEAANIVDSEASIRTAKLIGSELVARGVSAAVVTMGRRGCMVVDRNGSDHIPAFCVDMVDHTGAGDAFAGAMAAYFATDTDIRKAAKFASAAGALACAKIGGVDVLPNKEEIIELLQKEEM